MPEHMAQRHRAHAEWTPSRRTTRLLNLHLHGVARRRPVLGVRAELAVRLLDARPVLRAPEGQRHPQRDRDRVPAGVGQRGETGPIVPAADVGDAGRASRRASA